MGKFALGLMLGIFLVVVIVIWQRGADEWLPRCKAIEFGHCYTVSSYPTPVQ